MRDSSSSPGWPPLKIACVLIALCVALDLVFSNATIALGISEPGQHKFNVFYFLYATHEPLMLELFILGALGSWFYFKRPGGKGKGGGTLFPRVWRGHGVGICAALVGLICALGVFLVFRNFALCMDEYMSDFQSAIFSTGRLKAVVPAADRPFEAALVPFFVTDDPAHHTWVANYYPGYAMLRCLFFLMGMPWLTNVCLCAASVVLMAMVCRNVWPKDPDRPLLGAILLATSTQFLVNGMTAYPLPAHLFFNLLWLYLYTRKDGRGWWLIPWIGVVAVGLHQPVVHLLFAAPFFWRELVSRNWRTFLYWMVVYGFGCWLWWQWRDFIIIGRTDHPQTVGALSLPSFDHCLIEVMCAGLFISWQSFALSLLFVIGFCLPGRGPSKKERQDEARVESFRIDLCRGVVLSFIFYFFYPPDQGHGWGYRYLHAVLGNVVLVGLAGWDYLQNEFGAGRARRWLYACLALALFFQLPLRCWQAETFSRPFARAFQALRSTSKKYVVIDSGAAWYSWDLVRNDPRFLPGPRMLFASGLTDEMKKLLKRGDNVWYVQPEELAARGLRPTPKSDHDLQLEAGKEK